MFLNIQLALILRHIDWMESLASLVTTMFCAEINCELNSTSDQLVLPEQELLHSLGMLYQTSRYAAAAAVAAHCYVSH